MLASVKSRNLAFSCSFHRMSQKLTAIDRGLCLKMAEQLPQFDECCDPWFRRFHVKQSVWNVAMIWSQKYPQGMVYFCPIQNISM